MRRLDTYTPVYFIFGLREGILEGEAKGKIEGKIEGIQLMLERLGDKSDIPMDLLKVQVVRLGREVCRKLGSRQNN